VPRSVIQGFGLSCQEYAQYSAVMQKTGVIVSQMFSTATLSLILQYVPRDDDLMHALSLPKSWTLPVVL
jgi:hypothetical protein